MKKEPRGPRYDFQKNYFWIGMFFLFVQILVVVRNYFAHYLNFFWFCDFVPILFALAFFFKKEQIVKAIVNFGLLAQISFLILLTMGRFSSELIFSPFLNFVYVLGSILLHLSVVLALVLTYKIKPKLQTLYFSIVLIIAIYFMTLIFTFPADNINDLQFPGDLIKLHTLYFTLLWPVLTFVLLVLPTQHLQYLLYKFSIRKKRKN
jgi:hypothetical protein